MSFNNCEQLEQEARDTIKNVNVSDGMKRLNPLDEYYLAFFVYTCLQFLANGVYELIQVKFETLIKGPINYVF